MTNKNDSNNKNQGGPDQVEIDGVIFAYRCDICWQELDDTDIQFKPCNRCHLQVCLFCFNKHTNGNKAYSKTCPKCREPIDMDAIMKRNNKNIKNKNSIGKKLLQANKQRHSEQTNATNALTQTNQRHSNKLNHKNHKSKTHSRTDIDEEIPKIDWIKYLKGRFISRDSIIVAPVVAKFNNEEAISDNFKVYGRITRINMWDDESAHIMYDKQYFADALVDKIQDVAVRYQGQFGLMSAKYHFRRPCEEFMDPERRCPMQCRKFHGPYYKLDFIPLEQYLDEEQRDLWILHRKKLVSGIVKARYKKFRKKFMDGMPLPVSEHNSHSHTHSHSQNYNNNNRGNYAHNGRNDSGYYNEEYSMGYNNENEYYDHNDNRGYYRNNYRHKTWEKIGNNNNNGGQSKNANAITLKYTAMGRANKALNAMDSLQKHMRSRRNQPLPPARPPPPIPGTVQTHTTHSVTTHAYASVLLSDGHSVKSESISAESNSVSSLTKRTRPPIRHTTNAQMRPFMTVLTNGNRSRNGNRNVHTNNGLNKGNKVKKLMGLQKMTRTKSEEIMSANTNVAMSRSVMQLRSTKSDPNCDYDINGMNGHNSGDYSQKVYSHSSQNLQSETQIRTPKKKSKAKTVDLLKSLKKKKRKQRKTHTHPTRQPIPHSMSYNTVAMGGMPPKQRGVATFKPHSVALPNMNINPAFTNMNNANIGFHPFHQSPNPAQSYPFTVAPLLSTAVNPKKSKLNANAASYKPLSASSNTSSETNMTVNSAFKMPKIASNNNVTHNNNIKSFDIRNLGPLMTDNIHKNMDFNEFGAALNDAHLDLTYDHSNMDCEDQKMEIPNTNEQISSDDSSDDGYNLHSKWTEMSVWNEVLAIMDESSNNYSDYDWGKVRKAVKARVSVMDWTYIKNSGLIKQIKLRFRNEFESVSSNALREESVDQLLSKLSLKTSEALTFVNLSYYNCSVIDLDLRSSDISDYMTDLLTKTSVPSEYDTTIIAELGQILSIYQTWINHKKQSRDDLCHGRHEINESDGIKQLFGDNTLFGNGNNGGNHGMRTQNSDFYSRLLEEVQCKAENENNPKGLVLDYIGIGSHSHSHKKEEMKNLKTENTYENESELYNYEYSDDSEDEMQASNVDKENTKKQSDLKCPSPMDNVEREEGTEEELYAYDCEENESNENGIFSRVHSPPPRHRNGNDSTNVCDTPMQSGPMQPMPMSENMSMGMGNGDNRHYYNARYPPRRGRYGRNMEVSGGYYRQKNALNQSQNMRYNNNANNVREMHLNAQPKMEWKRKETHSGNKIEKEPQSLEMESSEIIIKMNAENEDKKINNSKDTIENEDK